MRAKATFARLREAIKQLPVIDTHGHLMPEEEAIRTPIDLFSFIYSGLPKTDLISAGLELPEGESWIGRGEREPEEIWKAIRPYLDHVRDCYYHRSQIAGFRDLYGFEEGLGDGNWRTLSEKISQQAKEKGWYREVMREKSKVELVLNDRPWTWARTPEGDRWYTANVMRVFDWTDLRPEFRRRAGVGGQPITSLEEALAGLEAYFEGLLSEGVAGLKMGQAYWRGLDFEEAPRRVAEQEFPRSLEGPPLAPRAVQDFMMFEVMRRADDCGLTVAFHTGLQAGNSNDIRNSRAGLLIPLMRRFPRARFDIFHASYPYSEEALVLAKYFPNVYFNFCGTNWQSPYVMKHLLHIALELVPSNKVFAYGGDAGRVEEAYGNLCVMGDIFAGVLAERVDSGFLSEERALGLARKFFHDNPYEAYRLEAWKERTGAGAASGGLLAS
jgi:hypothetical protein